MWMRRIASIAVLVLGLCSIVPSVFAADGDTTAEAAEVTAPTNPSASFEQMRAAIEAETNPELRQVMEEQLHLLESGQLDLTAERDAALRAQTEGLGASGQGLPEVGGLPGGGLIGPPVDGGTGPRGDEYLPPAARKELEELFQQGTGDPNSEKDRELREKAHEILEKYGVEPPEDWEHEGDWKDQGEGTIAPREAFERWLDSPDARGLNQETVDRYRQEAERSQETFERGGMPVEPQEAFERWVGSEEASHVDPETIEQYREQAEQYQQDFEQHEVYAPEQETSGTPERETSYEGHEQQYHESEYQPPQYEQPPQP